MERKSKLHPIETKVLQNAVLRRLERYEPTSSIAEDEAALSESQYVHPNQEGESHDESKLLAMQAALVLRISEKKVLLDLYGDGPKRKEIEGGELKRARVQRLVDASEHADAGDDEAGEEEDDELFGVNGSKAKKIKLNTHVKF